MFYVSDGSDANITILNCKKPLEARKFSFTDLTGTAIIRQDQCEFKQTRLHASGNFLLLSNFSAAPMLCVLDLADYVNDGVSAPRV